jgi:hypothetical protein
MDGTLAKPQVKARLVAQQFLKIPRPWATGHNLRNLIGKKRKHMLTINDDFLTFLLVNYL